MDWQVTCRYLASFSKLVYAGNPLNRNSQSGCIIVVSTCFILVLWWHAWNLRRYREGVCESSSGLFVVEISGEIVSCGRDLLMVWELNEVEKEERKRKRKTSVWIYWVVHGFNHRLRFAGLKNVKFQEVTNCALPILSWPYNFPFNMPLTKSLSPWRTSDLRGIVVLWNAYKGWVILRGGDKIADCADRDPRSSFLAPLRSGILN